jgi:hypothetical protein
LKRRISDVENGGNRMEWIFGILFIFGLIASLAWYGAEEPMQTVKQKMADGILSVIIWPSLIVRGNSLL